MFFFNLLRISNIISHKYLNLENGRRCSPYEWRCENGPCISTKLRCDGRVDCPYDMSDEFDCPAGSKNMKYIIISPC